MLQYIKKSAAIACVFMACCSPIGHKDSGQPDSIQELEKLISRDFSVVRSLAAESYLLNLKNRLLEDRITNLKILLTSSSSIFALSFGPGVILISTGLIEACDNESELAFIIAHEYAHIDQKHFEDQREDLSSEDLKTRELTADSEAFEIVFEAGFSLQGAAGSIKKFNSLHSQMVNTQPVTTERLSNIKWSWIGKMCGARANCSDSGTLDSREFQTFRSLVR